MSYTNPAKYKIQKLEEQLKKGNVVKEEKKENIVSLDSILQEKKKASIDIEFIEIPHSARITGVPRPLDLEFTKLGVASVKYENAFDSVKKIV